MEIPQKVETDCITSKSIWGKCVVKKCPVIQREAIEKEKITKHVIGEISKSTNWSGRWLDWIEI